MITHYHIHTTHKSGTPDFPSKGAVHVYLTGCGKELESTYQDKEFKITQFQNELDTIDCNLCKAWANHYFKQNKIVSGTMIYMRSS